MVFKQISKHKGKKVVESVLKNFYFKHGGGVYANTK